MYAKIISTAELPKNTYPLTFPVFIVDKHCTNWGAVCKSLPDLGEAAVGLGGHTCTFEQSSWQPSSIPFGVLTGGISSLM